MRRYLGLSVALLAVCFLAVGASPAATVMVDLQAGVTTKTLPDSATVTMWGFGLLAGSPSVPGPQITVTEGDTLTLNVTNNLSGPVSLAIAGQISSMSPQFFMDGQGRQRVRSFTHETPVSATRSYTWTNLEAGTYMYRSATHPAVQVQMGLYGAIVVQSATAGQAYAGATSVFDNELVVLYSEIDPVLHAAVAGGTYVPFGDPATQTTSTIGYDPKYFLINGEAYSAGTPVLSAGAASERLLVRFINAGLKTHVPMLLGVRMSLLAEGGNEYAYPRDQYTLTLAAGQTRDAIITIPSGAVAGTRYPVLDRMMSLTNNGSATPGGMLRFLEVQ